MNATKACVPVIICLCVWAPFTMGCFQENDQFGVDYFLSIHPNSTYQYYVLAPIAVTQSGGLTGLEDRYWISYGNGSLAVEESEYGYVLNVTGSGKMAIELHGTVSNHDYISLGTRVDANGDGKYQSDEMDYYVYADLPANETLRYYQTLESRARISIDGEIQYGWQALYGGFIYGMP